MSLVYLTKEENQKLITRAIAADGYPASEALYGSVIEYIEFLEGQLGIGPCKNTGGHGPCRGCDCGS